MAGIILKLNEIMDALPSSEQKVAVYMVSNLDDIVGVSVESWPPGAIPVRPQ